MESWRTKFGHTPNAFFCNAPPRFRVYLATNRAQRRASNAGEPGPEIQRKTAVIKDKMESQRMSYEAKHWSAATSCAMQLQQAVG